MKQAKTSQRGRAAAVCLGFVCALNACKGTAFQRQSASPSKSEATSLALAADACVADSSALKTDARLVNTSLRSGAVNNALTYEIALVDCAGQHHAITEQPIFFAVNAEVGEDVASDFIAANGAEEVRGSMQLVEGEDMFGARGPEFFHHRTDKALSMSDTAADTALQFTVNLGGQRFYPVGGGNLGRFTVNTYIRIGDAAPAVQEVEVIP